MDPNVQAILDKYAENMKAMCDMMARLSETIQANNVPQRESAPQRVPFPKPLEVERGDLQENFALWERNWKEYVVAAKIDQWPDDQESVKINLLLSFIGDEAKKKFNYFDLKDEDKTTAENVLLVIKSRLVSSRSLLYDRFVFHGCNQLEGEPFKDYLLRLKKCGDLCKYNENVTSDMMLRDRIVFGINNKNLVKKFLAENSDTLTLEKVIQECQINEETDNRMKKVIEEEKSVMKIQSRQPRCKFCGNVHPFKKGECPANGRTCNYCDEKNHFEKVCPKKEKKSRTGAKSIKFLDKQGSDSDSSSDSDSALKINKISRPSERNLIQAELKLKVGKWKTVQCELDTGSSVSVIGYKQYCDLIEGSRIELKKSDLKIQSFGGLSIPILGEIDIACKRFGKKYSINFKVVNMDTKPLLSAEACMVLNLIKLDKEESTKTLKEELKILAAKVAKLESGEKVVSSKYSNQNQLKKRFTYQQSSEMLMKSLQYDLEDTNNWREYQNLVEKRKEKMVCASDDSESDCEVESKSSTVMNQLKDGIEDTDESADEYLKIS